MAIYQDKTTGELVYQYRYTGNNKDFIIDKLINEHGFDGDKANEIVNNYMSVDNVIVVPKYKHILTGCKFDYAIMAISRFLQDYTPYITAK